MCVCVCEGGKKGEKVCVCFGGGGGGVKIERARK